MLFTPFSPHLNLLSRRRLQRPAYEEFFEAGALLRFIESPTTTRKPKSETFVTTPVMPSSQKNVSARKRFPENLSQLLCLPVVPQTPQCKFLIH